MNHDSPNFPGFLPAQCSHQRLTQQCLKPSYRFYRDFLANRITWHTCFNKNVDIWTLPFSSVPVRHIYYVSRSSCFVKTAVGYPHFSAIKFPSSSCCFSAVVDGLNIGSCIKFGHCHRSNPFWKHTLGKIQAFDILPLNANC